MNMKITEIRLHHPECLNPKQYKFCGECKQDKLHSIERYSKATSDLKLYKFVCLNCFYTGEE